MNSSTFYRIVMSILFTCVWQTLAAGPVAPSPKLMVFSDVDDTIKISNVREFKENAAFSVFKDSLFYGMNSVYQALKEDQEVILGKKGIDFTYVTNGVNFTVNETHGAILKDFGFPDPGHYFPRTLKDLIKKKEHKFDTIMAQVSANDPQHVILIGDNGESDPKVYDKITKAIGARALKKGKQVKVSVYIHMVYTPKNKKTLDLFPGQQAFYNAGDLAILMNRDGLLSADKKSAIVKDVLIKVRNESKFKVYGPLVYPYFKTRNMGLLGIKLSCLSTYQ